MLDSHGARNVWSVRTDGTGLRALTHYTKAVSDVESLEHFSPTFFYRYSLAITDGRKVYFDLFTQPCNSCHDGPIGVVKIDGGATRFVYLPGPKDSGDPPACPVVSPDGREIAYSTKSGLWVVSLADTARARLIVRFAVRTMAGAGGICPLTW
jgi:hypothetical protein